MQKKCKSPIFVLVFCASISYGSFTTFSSEYINKKSNSVRSKHCYIICPKNKSSTNLEIEREGFLLNYNTTTKYADWVAYKIELKNLSGSQKPRVWKADPKLPKKVALIPSDYKDAYKKCKYDRGHQAPLADFTNSKEWEVTNYLSNITPQKSQLNRGSWYDLEHSIRDLAKKNKGDIYIMTGPYYNGKPMCSLPYARLLNIIPNGYWKIVTYVEKDHVFRIGFIFEQETPKSSNYCRHKATIADISRITNLNFGSIDQTTTSALLLKNLGCRQ